MQMRRVTVGMVALLALIGLPASVSPAAASASPAATAPSGLQVTLVARSCPTYTDVTANRARNNIQESLRDLGADTLYGNGEPISVAKEDAGQPACTPIPNWTFTLGSGYRTGNPENPSVVTGANGSAVTAASTPELDQYGNDTGRTVAGAVTVTLTDAQAQLASRSSSLWVQGGTPTDPLNDAQFPGVYGFAALRCAIDNLNGDNVEWVGFPQGTSHVFCYAYYVTPPPGAATIVVKKQTVDAANDALNLPQATSFAFQGNVSYNNQPLQGAFSVPVAAGSSTGTTTFIRGETGTPASPDSPPWQFNELANGGWALVDATCVSSSGQSRFAIDPDTSETTITKLVEGDTVTCTYRNRPVQAGDLALTKVTRNGYGGPFSFAVTPPRTSPSTFTASTTQPDVPVLVHEEPAGGPLGTYSVAETLPATSAAGSWAMTEVTCIGATPVVDLAHDSFTVDVTTDNQAAACQVANTFTPTASITIRKITVAGTTTADFDVTALDPTGPSPQPSLNQTATTVTPGVAATATGDPTTGLALGTYQIYETSLAPSDTGVWRLTGLDCGAIVDGASTEVTLTEETPHVTCTFTDTLVADGSLTVTKAITGDHAARTGAVVVEATCADGATFELTAPAGDTGPWSATASGGFTEPTSCTFTETTTGAAAGASVDTSWAVTADNTGCLVADPCPDPDPAAGTSLVATADVEPGQAVTVAFTDDYTAAPVTTTSTSTSTSVAPATEPATAVPGQPAFTG